jgi:recombination protein RecT
MKDIEKRIPRTASVEFWGGEKKKFNSNELEKVEGWKDEMVWKTIKRAAWDAVNIDSQKIDEKIQKILVESEELVKEDISNLVEKEVKKEANKEALSFDTSVIDEAEVIDSEVLIPTASPEMAFEQSENQAGF